jgi:hypothetical protein
MSRRQPERLTGSHGVVSGFGSLNEWLLSEADAFLSDHPELYRRSVTPGGYFHYEFSDRSEIWIRNTGQVIRLPEPIYAEDGSRISWLRLNITTGDVLPSDDWHKLPLSEQEWVVMNNDDPNTDSNAGMV